MTKHAGDETELATKDAQKLLAEFFKLLDRRDREASSTKPEARRGASPKVAGASGASSFPNSTSDAD